MNNIETIYGEFLNYLIAEKNVSKTTVDSYKCDLNVLLRYLSSKNIKYNIEEIKTSDLRNYVTYLKNDMNYQVRTIRRKINSLSSFYKYCIEMEYIIKNPMLPIHAPKEPEELPVYIIEEDLKKLILAPIKNKSVNSIRDKTILETFAYTGIRRSELINLNWEDIDFKNNTITIKRGKGNKQRQIPLIQPLDVSLWTYLQLQLPLKNKAIFLSPCGERINTSDLQTMFQKYLKQTSLTNKGYTIHKLRHTFATYLVKNGASILAVKELLGHVDLNTTKVYTHLNMDYLTTEIRKLGPIF